MSDSQGIEEAGLSGDRESGSVILYTVLCALLVVVVVGLFV